MEFELEWVDLYHLIQIGPKIQSKTLLCNK